MTRSVLTGAVLAGGASSRFGSDKFTYPLDDTTMGGRALGVLHALGVDRLLVVSPDPAHGAPDATRIAGPREGHGPFAAVLDTLESIADGVLVTLPCDLPAIEAADLRLVVEALDDGCDVAYAEADGPHPTVAAWNVQACLEPLRLVYLGGERALHRAIAGVRSRGVELRPECLHNVNTREQLLGMRGTPTR